MSGAHSLDLTAPAGDPGSPVHGLDPRAKVMGLVALTVVAVSTSLAAWPVFVACGVAVAVLAALARVPPKQLWLRIRVVLPLVLLLAIFVPFVRPGGAEYEVGPLTVHQGGLEVMALIAAKATIGALSAALLLTTTGFAGILRGLEGLRVPRAFVLITGFTYRYLFVIAEEVRRMRSAVVARGYRPKTALRAGAMGRVAGTLFVRSHDRGERVYRAMLARGWNGSMPHLVQLRLQAADAVFLAAVVVPLLALRVALGLTYHYPDGRAALRGVDLHVDHGGRVALLGPNGAGKTTLMMHLNGLLRGTGELEVAELEVGPKNLADLRSRVGLVFQDPDDQLFMPTVREDIAFGPLNMGLDEAEVGRRVDEALGSVRMGHAVDRAPHQLSMGERRRVAIATVLAMGPQLLVLDEPSANLDPRARRELLDVLEGFERTMLVTTHDLPLAAELCEPAVVLADGTVVADGPCTEILGDSALLAAHDLELPAGFDLGAVERRPHPREGAAAEGVPLGSWASMGTATTTSRSAHEHER